MCIATGLRNTFAHGVFTAAGAGLTTKRKQKIIDEFQSINKKQINPVSTNYSETESDIKFEPHLAKTLEILLPLYIENTIYQALIASRAGELANRVNAMTAATDNANTLISQLTLTYNKARQASITQEISEIVAGAESLV